MKYIEFNGLKLYLPSSVSLKKGKKAGDYSANWSNARGGANLKGKEYRFTKGSEDHKLIRQLVWEKYGQVYRPSANEDCKLIDEERAMDYLNTPTPNCKITGIKYGKGQLNLVDNNEVRVSSKEISQVLGIQHSSFVRNINTFKNDIEEFGVLLFEISKPQKGSKGGRPEVVYFLNRPQCEFLGMLSKNTEQVVIFKKWIIKRFNEIKHSEVFSSDFQSFAKCISNKEENIIQQLLILLSSYTDNPLRQEVVIDDSHHRVDLMSTDNSIAIELKTHLITPAHIRRYIFEKDYYGSLKKKFSNFETLIFSSTVGINQDAKEMIKYNNPYFRYYSIPELSEDYLRSKPYLRPKFQYLLQSA